MGDSILLGMLTRWSPGPSDPGTTPVEADLSRTYTLVLVVEIIVILALYGLGKYFA